MRQHEGTKVSSFDSNPSPYMFGKSSIKTINILPPAWSTPVENSRVILPPALLVSAKNSTVIFPVPPVWLSPAEKKGQNLCHMHGQSFRKQQSCNTVISNCVANPCRKHASNPATCMVSPFWKQYMYSNQHYHQYPCMVSPWWKQYIYTNSNPTSTSTFCMISPCRKRFSNPATCMVSSVKCVMKQ